MPDPIDPLSLLLEGIADYAIFLLDREGRVSRWSTSARKVFGYSAEEIQGRHFSCLYPEEGTDSTTAAEELEMAAAHGRFEDIDWRVRRDRSRFWADSVICPLLDEKGQVQGYSQIIRDITERKKSEEALKQKEEELSQARKMQALGRLAGGIAHDFNNFITGIVGLADDIRLSMTEHDPRREDLAEIIKTADQARMLTRELLAFGRRQVSAPKVVNLNEVLRSKQKMLMRILGADIQLKLQLEPGIRNILIDPTQLDQILINLLMNSRDAMPQGGNIHVETRRIPNTGPGFQGKSSGPQVVLVISDSGVGMDDRVLTQVFEPFFTTKEPGKGTGLGLATVYGIVDQNHGSISVQSQPGHGTTIQIQFPEIDAPVEMAEPAEAPLAIFEKGSETILVVDDTAIVRRVVTMALQNGGYHVLSASTGAEALEFARKYGQDIHLMVTDVIMPEMNGRQLAEQIEAINPDIAVLYMSGFAEDFVLERGFLRENMAFIEKPLSGASLLNKVREMLHNQRLASSSKSL